MLKSLLIICTVFFTLLKLSAQDENVQPKFKQVLIYIPKAKIERLSQKNSVFIVDSLKTLISTYDSLIKNNLLQSKTKDDSINELNYKINRQKIIGSRLNLQASKYEAMNLQTRKNNFILLIFNSIVCVLLLLMLIRYLLTWRKKKSIAYSKHIKVSASAISDFSSFIKPNKIGINLKQLERIGKLRDIGTLTEEEFIAQKRIILENRN